MTNPWLIISASDYEGHMSSPNVDQLSFLSAQFKEALDRHDCNSIALLGCATGNGLEHIKKGHVRRVTTVDINPEYLEVLRKRYGNCIPGLEVVQADLEICDLENDAYSLVFAGLVFEYVEPHALLRKIAGWLQKDGILVAILQLPSESATVADTPHTSLKSLRSIMNLVNHERFTIIAADACLSAIEEKVKTIETGKSFFVGTYKRM